MTGNTVLTFLIGNHQNSRRVSIETVICPLNCERCCLNSHPNCKVKSVVLDCKSFILALFLNV